MTPDNAAICVTALTEARVKYWAQWGLAATYSEDDMAALRRIATRYKSPAVLAAKMEKAMLRVEAPYRKMIERAA